MRAFTLIVLTAICSSAKAELSGTFTCQHNEKITVMAGGRSVRQSAFETTKVTLNPDGTTFAINPALPGDILPGTWYVSKGKIYFNPDLNKAAEFVVRACSLSGANCVFLGETFNYNMRVNKAGTEFGGTNTIKLSMLVNGQLRTASTVDRVRCRK